MTTNVEKVQYEIEVVTKGREELEKFREAWKDVTEQTTENTEASQDNVDITEQVEGRLKKTSDPLRGMADLFSKLNPTVLLSSLGLAGVSTALLGLSNEADKRISSIAGVAAAINQFSSEQVDLVDVWSRLSEESDKLKLPIKDLEDAYGFLVPLVRDYNTAQGLIFDAWEIHRQTGIDFKDVVKTLGDAYSDGAYVMDENGGKYLLGADAVKAVGKAMRDAGVDVIQFKTTVDDNFSVIWEDAKVTMLAGAAGLITLFKGVVLEIFDPGAVNEAAEESFSGAADSMNERLLNDITSIAIPAFATALGTWFRTQDVNAAASAGFADVPDKIIDSMRLGDVDAEVEARLGEIFHPDEVAQMAYVAGMPAAENIRGGIESNWVNSLENPFQQLLAVLFSPQDISTKARVAFEVVVPNMWDAISSRWDSIDGNWWDKLKGLFDWGRIGELVDNPFTQIPQRAFGGISASWVGQVLNPFIALLDILFSPQTMLEKVTAAFSLVGGWIHDFVVGGVLNVVLGPWGVLLGQLFNPADVLKFVVGAWLWVPQKVLELLSTPWGAVVVGWNALLGILFDPGGVLEWVTNAFKDVVGWAFGLISTPWGAVVAGFVALLGLLFNPATVLSAIQTAFGNVASWIWGILGPSIAGVIAAFGGAWRAVTNVIAAPVQAGVNIARSAINSIISLINNIPSVNVPFIGGGGGGGGDTPQLQEGGVAMRPTRAIVGDVPEAILPLSKFPGLLSGAAAGGGGPTTIIVELDGRTIAETQIPHLDRMVRVRGAR